MDTKRIRKQLIKLLNIHGISGQEGNVRRYLQPILKYLMDSVEVDAYGNLLATKKVGNGEGATVLLSSHMDTVKGVLADRKLLEDNGIITSDKGVLGADDRAGIAIILEVLKNIDKLSFDGTIKVAFSREEEIGCIGAEKIDPKFYEDVDLAIIVDRRGNRDIVVGNYYMPFCSDAVGNFMEDVSALLGANWKCVEGGVSDAMVFAEHNINSINLSAGYEHEHTSKEFVIVEDMRDTLHLILQTFAVINDFNWSFGDVPKENEWVKEGYINHSSGYSSTYNNYYEDTFENDFVYAESFDANGDVFVYELGKDIGITQGEREIVMTRESLKSLVNQLKKVL